MNERLASRFPLTPANLTLRHPELGTGPVPTDIYWQPEFYAREMAAIFKRTWLCMGRIEQVAKVGDFFVKRIPTFNLSVLVVRGKDQKNRAFDNVCQHLRIPAQADHRFQWNPISDSGASRSLIPVEADQFSARHGIESAWI